MKRVDVTRNDFLQLASEGIYLDGGESKYVVKKINDENFELSKLFKEQLIQENLYDNSYAGLIVPSEMKEPYSQQYLPIYGDSKKYVTKWFDYFQDNVIRRDLKQKELCLLIRANK